MHNRPNGFSIHKFLCFEFCHHKISYTVVLKVSMARREEDPTRSKDTNFENSYTYTDVDLGIIIVLIKNSDSCQLCLIHNAFTTSAFLQKAEAELAYELQGAKVKQSIRSEEIQIDIVERRKQIDIEEKEIQRKEKELKATIKLPAEAEAFKVNVIAEGQR